MSKVYMVSDGSYSDWSVRGLFSAAEKAETFMAKWRDNDWNSVEEWVLDPEVPLRKDLFPWFVRMKPNGDTVEAYVDNSPMGFDGSWERDVDYYGNMYTHVWARDQEHAVKIANERRVQMIANNELEAK